MKLEIEVCDYCKRKPKAGLRLIFGQLTEQLDGASPLEIFGKSARLCPTCRDRVYRFMERAFAKKQ